MFRALIFVLAFGSVGVASADNDRFDFSIDTPWKTRPAPTVITKPLDPERCDADLGWIEIVSGQSDTEVEIYPAPFSRKIRVNRGSQVEYVERRPYRHGRGPLSREPGTPARIELDYLGCVTPTGRTTLKLDALLTVDIGAGSEEFRISYAGPPFKNESGIGRKDLTQFKVATLRGDAILTSLSLPDQWGWSHGVRIDLRIQSKGATE